MSFLPGLHALTEKVPELLTVNGFLRLVGTLFGILIVVLLALLWFDGWFGAPMPFGAIVLQLAIYGVLHYVMRSFFRGREERLDYTDAFFNRALIAVALNACSVLFILLTRGGVEGGADRLVPGLFAWPVALYLLASAILLLVRGLRAAGVDTLAGVYIYYPDEGRQIEDTVYGVVRHPLYSALDRTAIAFGLINGTPMALLLAVFFVAVWHPVWYGLEERDLVNRFGDAYRTYMARVPAVLPPSVQSEITLWDALTRRGA
jgi:protein-S-isoprenylcysteine O-methyltransferase Ste14